MCRAPSLAVAASRWCCAPFLLAVASRWCHRLPRRISTHRLQRSGNLFRTDFRFAPSLPQRFACGLLPFTRDMGVHGLCGRVPDSAGSICPQGVDRALRSKLLTALLHLKHHLPSCSWPGALFEQITARTNPCSRHLWGTLARAVASI